MLDCDWSSDVCSSDLTVIADTACVATSFPEFWGLLSGLGARVALA
jgi:5-enolpyruvylshikimate-3-phosphate synthase